jgi:transcription-repair coupling factor (superfamily II helicase)
MIESPGQRLVVTPNDEMAESIANDTNEFLGHQAAFHFPEWGVDPYQWRPPVPAVVGTRLEALRRLQDSGPFTVTASVRALLEPTLSPAELRESSLLVEVDREMEMEQIIARLSLLGYERYPVVEEVGNYAVRGGILDVFPHTTENPVRIEFFGDIVESIRSFSVARQRSIENVKSVEILPQREALIDGGRLEKYLSVIPDEAAAEALREKFKFGIDFPGLEWAASLFLEKRSYVTDYLAPDASLYVLEPSTIQSEAESMLQGFASLFERATLSADFLPQVEKIYLSPESLLKACASRGCISELAFRDSGGGTIDFGTGDHPVVNAQIKLLHARLEEFSMNGRRVFIACDNRVQLERMEEIIGGHRSDVSLIVADLTEGFTYPAGNMALLCDHQLFARRYHRYRVRRSKEGVALASYTNLNVGDFIVHVDYGIGKYRGLKEITVDGRRRDCLLIHYQDDDRLYVPIEEFNRVQKYVGKDGAPQLTRLGGTTWEKVKARTKKAIAAMAEDLIKLYAERKSKPGFAFSADDNWIRQLEASFPYDETPDQLAAIADIKKDMTVPHPMDRLVCGDVGFGKTEVAIRAAFKAVSDGKQVAVLVPTTILAQQHLATFSERLRDFPINIEMMSRFKNRQELKEIARKLSAGELDIVIGTHRLLSADVGFKDLGLLVVDEEQRFGVSHKEKIKKMKRLVDVLTMTATPIPRTMQMSLLGARDMSVINTSPKDRLPIRTEIVEFHPETIRQAVLSEVERGGQVFFVHNRVQTIQSIRRYIEKLLPGIRICVGHGQMPEKELEEVMLGFLKKNHDVLLSTSIIESGLDIPSVNTIIINRADRFGLAQLYQLRGRVGRSSLKAVAYLLIPPVRLLTQTARKRLKAIEQHTDLGSGFHLALRDLEIRGAGNLLGPQQHGFIEEVGFDLYLRLLEEAISGLRGEEPQPTIDIKIDTDVDLFISKEYVSDNQLKVDVYQRLAQAVTYAQINDLELELTDRFGRLPVEAENLFRLAEIRLLAARAKLSKFVFKRGVLRLTYPPDMTPGKKKIAAIAAAIHEPLEFATGERFEIAVDISSESKDTWHQRVKIILQNLI